MSSYKFRAEFLSNIDLLKRMLSDARFEVNYLNEQLPDIEVCIDTHLAIEEIIQIMELITDSHVMRETLAPATNFTGRRTYNRNSSSRQN